MTKLLVWSFLVVVVLTGGVFLYLNNAEKTPISHLWEGYRTWYKPSGDTPITGDDTRFLDGKHQGNDGYRVIYINNTGEATNKGQRPYRYPEGTVVVKEQYKSKEHFESGGRPSLNIMIRLADGFSPKTGDWGYITQFRRKIHKGTSNKAQFCNGCHKTTNLKKGDFVFINSSTHQNTNNLLK